MGGSSTFADADSEQCDHGRGDERRRVGARARALWPTTIAAIAPTRLDVQPQAPHGERRRAARSTANTNGGTAPTMLSAIAPKPISASISLAIGEIDATAVRSDSATATIPTSASAPPVQRDPGEAAVTRRARRRRAGGRRREAEQLADAQLVRMQLVDQRLDDRNSSSAGCSRRSRARSRVVQVEVLVEQVRLDLVLRHAVERRVVADRHRGAVALAVDAAQAA